MSKLFTDIELYLFISLSFRVVYIQAHAALKSDSFSMVYE